MIRIVPINRSGISQVIEYDTSAEHRAIIAMLGVTEFARLKLGQKRNYSMFGWDYIEEFSDMVHCLNAKGLEVAHTLMDMDGCPHKIAMFETPREWADEIKDGHRITELIPCGYEILLQIAPEVKKT